MSAPSVKVKAQEGLCRKRVLATRGQIRLTANRSRWCKRCTSQGIRGRTFDLYPECNVRLITLYAKPQYPDGSAWRAAALVTVRAVQWSQPHVRQRYMLGESSDTLYCAFMGTKFRRDLVTNANVPLVPLWAEPGSAAMTANEVGAMHGPFQCCSRVEA